MTEAVNYLFCANVETYGLDVNSEEERSVVDEKTSFIARAAIDSLGEVVEFYKELCNTGFLKRDNLIITQESASFKNKGSITAEDRVCIHCKEIESSGSIEAKSAELIADRVSLLGEKVSIKADQLVINAREILVDSASVEALLTIERCEQLELRYLNDDALAVWQAAAPASCNVIIINEVPKPEESSLTNSEELNSSDQAALVVQSEVELSDAQELVVSDAVVQSEVESSDAQELAVGDAVVQSEVESSDAQELAVGDAVVQSEVESSDAQELAVGDAVVQSESVELEESQLDKLESVVMPKEKVTKGFLGL